MNKVFCNKETNLVEQILKELEGEHIGEDYFPNCYMIEDKEEKINTYNLRYNKEEGLFEVVEGLEEKDTVITIKKPDTEDLEKLKNENDELRAKIEKIEKLLNI